MGFEIIQGQQLLKKALQRSLETGETGHAYLFSGPAGSGKRTLALLFAQALNCSSSQPPCCQCLSCRKSEGGNHPDFYRLQPLGSSLKIEQLREIKESFYYYPVEGRYKICIIEDGDLLTAAAANSLLKILEEPPDRLVFIILTTRPWALLPTILSRCLSFALKPLQLEEMETLLEQHGKLTPQERELVFSLSGGNPGQALALAEQVDWREKFVEARALLQEVEEGPADGIFLLAEELSARSDLPALMEIMLIVCRDRLVRMLKGCTAEVMVKEREESQTVTPLAEKPDLHVLLQEKIFSAILQLQAELRGNVNRRLALEVLFLQMRGVI